MAWRKTRRGVTLTLVPVGTALAGGALAMACTLPVGQTAGTPAAEPGEQVTATGEVSHSLEEASNCGDDGDLTDAECTYALGVVNPADVDEGPDAEPTPEPAPHVHSTTCHYETKQSHQRDSSTGDIAFATVDDDPDETEVPGGRALVGDGPLPAEDDGGQAMEPGETVMCFYSDGFVGGSGDSLDADYLNNREDGAATATMPQPFVVLEESRADGVGGS